MAAMLAFPTGRGAAGDVVDGTLPVWRRGLRDRRGAARNLCLSLPGMPPPVRLRVRHLRDRAEGGFYRRTRHAEGLDAPDRQWRDARLHLLRRVRVAPVPHDAG